MRVSVQRTQGFARLVICTPGAVGRGGGVLPYMGFIGVCAAVKGMVFKQFTLG